MAASSSAPPSAPSAPGLPSPAPRRIATPSWLDLRLVLGVLLVLISVLIGAKIVAGASKTYATVAVRHDLAAGTILTGDDLQLVQAQLPDRGRGIYLSKSSAAVGKRLNRPVTRGELLPAGAISAISSQTTLTVPLAAGAAPTLRGGQRIEVWISTASCASVVLLPDVTVQSVHGDSGGSFSSGTGAQNVVISVQPDVASRVIQALAIDAAQLRAGVLLGPPQSSGSPAPSASAPSGVPADPASNAPASDSAGHADLASCSSVSPTR